MTKKKKGDNEPVKVRAETAYKIYQENCQKVAALCEDEAVQ